MNTEPKNDTPTLYPFRLEEAKLNKGNVVTRDGGSAKYIGVWKPGATFPLLFELSDGEGTFTEEGYFWRTAESRHDLFMTTPAPLPAQAPEEQSLEAQTILRLKRERDEARAWAADKDMCDKAATARAESAEARVAALEGELAEVKEQVQWYKDQMAEWQRGWSAQRKVLLKERNDAHEKLRTSEPAPAWIPVSTPPTEGDGRSMKGLSGIKFHGMVLWGTEDFCCIGHYDKKPEWATCWTHIPPLPPTIPPEEETERKAAKKAYNKYIEDAPNGRVASFDDFFIGWHAARQSAPTEV